jgi:hypothetical protein
MHVLLTRRLLERVFAGVVLLLAATVAFRTRMALAGQRFTSAGHSAAPYGQAICRL